MKSYLKMETHPLADPKNVVKSNKYRITVLTEHLLRLEYSEDGEFIDAASQTVVNRDFPATEFHVDFRSRPVQKKYLPCIPRMLYTEALHWFQFLYN